MRVATVSAMRELDRRASSEFDISEEVLMENAGTAGYLLLLRRFGGCLGRPLVVCGAGNNGGDGFVVARRLASDGCPVRIVVATGSSAYTEAARNNLTRCERLGIQILTVDSAACPPALTPEVAAAISDCTLLVDALFGTGLGRPVTEPYASLISAMNAARVPRVSLDIPSGIGGDSALPCGTAVQADATVTFGLPKLGNVIYPGAAFNGDLYVSHISFPSDLRNDSTLLTQMNEPLPLPERPADGHKGSFGKLLVIGGSRSYLGAPRLSATAFLRSGGGMAYLGAPRGITTVLGQDLWEAVLLPQAETSDGGLAAEALNCLLEGAKKADVAVIGPGLGLTEDTEKLVIELCRKLTIPIALDGDALTIVAKHLTVLNARSAPTVLTPHPLEFARLLSRDKVEPGGSTVDLVRDFAKGHGVTVVFKGARSLIAEKSGDVWINFTGNSGMGTAGSGDVLTGIIAAFLGVGYTGIDAARLAVFVHGLAGDVAAKELGEAALTARDIVQFLPDAFGLLKDREANTSQAGNAGSGDTTAPFVLIESM